MPVDNETVDRVAELAKLNFNDDAKEDIKKDLNKMLNFVDKLNELNTENVEPLTSVAATTLKFRSDEVKNQNIREQIIKNSPEDNEDFFVVPKVVE